MYYFNKLDYHTYITSSLQKVIIKILILKINNIRRTNSQNKQKKGKYEP